MKKCWMMLAMALLIVTTVHAEENVWETACFDGMCMESYEDDGLRIAIGKVAGDGYAGFVADVQIRDASGFHAGIAQGGFDTLSHMAEQAGAVLAVNADDYATHKNGVILRNGEVLRKKKTTRHLLAVLPDGSFETVSDRKAETPTELANRLTALGVQNTFEFGPILVEEGHAVRFPSSFDLISTSEKRREPRTAIGMISLLHYVILVIDGRQPGYSDGISLQMLQQLFVEFGAQTAINLDGGGSTELWFMGEILNQPAGGKERSLSDCIWF